MRSIDIKGETIRLSTGNIAGKLTNLSKRYSLFLLIDKKVYHHYSHLFVDYPLYVFPSGERYKSLSTARKIINCMLDTEVDRSTMLVGIGGGVTTDMAGFVAAIYMRGIRFGFVPTTLLAMVDASLGGKNGIDWGTYKNIVGTIVQPSFLHYDYTLLESLVKKEWRNGFSEIIKHACIADRPLFEDLERYSMDYYISKKVALRKLVERNIMIKSKVVNSDPYERGHRRVLNFGHTIAHAIERAYSLSHGQAVAIGMVAMSWLSEVYCQFKERERIIQLLRFYELPVSLPSVISDTIYDAMSKDKKKQANSIHEIFLKRIGYMQQLKLSMETYRKASLSILSKL